MVSILLFQDGIYDESLGSFFRNVDSRYDDPADIPLGSGRGKIRSLKARVRLTPSNAFVCCNNS